MARSVVYGVHPALEAILGSVDEAELPDGLDALLPAQRRMGRHELVGVALACARAVAGRMRGRNRAELDRVIALVDAWLEGGPDGFASERDLEHARGALKIAYLAACAIGGTGIDASVLAADAGVRAMRALATDRATRDALIADLCARFRTPRPPPPQRTLPPPACERPPVLDALYDEYAREPGNREALRVWADALAAVGDPRGELIHLSLLPEPTPAQREHRTRMVSRLRDRVVGPARVYVSSHVLGDDGLVRWASCTGEQLVAGFAELARLNPRLVLAVTHLTTREAPALGELPLDRIAVLDVEVVLTERQLVRLAPALGRARRLVLRADCVTAAGLRVLADTATKLELLAIRGRLDALLEPPATARFRIVSFTDDAELARLVG